MKNWKKFVIVPALGLAFGLAGVQTTQAKTLPVVSEVSTRVSKEDYSRLLEQYRNLNIDSLVSEGFEFDYKRSEIEDGSKVIEWFKIRKENLCVDYMESITLKNGDDSFSMLYMSNEYTDYDNEQVTYYDTNGKPYSIMISTYKPTDSASEERIPKKHISLMRSLDDYVYVVRYSEYAVDKEGNSYEKIYIEDEIKDKEPIKEIKEFFGIASENYEKVQSLIKDLKVKKQ